MQIYVCRVASVASLWLTCGYALAVNTGFLGNAPISRMNSEDVDLFYAAVTAVLDQGADGAGVRWGNVKTGAGGTLTPLNSYQGGTGPCRDLEIDNAAGGLKNRSVFTLCKTPSGEWKIRQD